jgi:hypothetical protein
VQGGFFLRKKPLGSSGFEMEQLKKRYGGHRLQSPFAAF